MEKVTGRYFYLFTGNWAKKREELELLLTQENCFEIWEPYDRNKNINLLIVYDQPIPEMACVNKHIWRTTPSIYNVFFEQRMQEFKRSAIQYPVR
jgi:hypothetical protein